MITSELEYLFLAELITMPDRELAQKIELHIWYRTFVPQPRILAQYLNALKESDNPKDFRLRAEKILEVSGLEFVQNVTGEYQTRTPSQNPPGYIEITQEEMLKAETQEPQV